MLEACQGTETMKIGGRDVKHALRALLARPNYVAAANMFRVYERPIDMYGRYLFRTGQYPTAVRVRTPLGPLELALYSADDVLTVNEIFCRNDYQATKGDSIFVDFGSNIGISAAYFLSRSRNAFAYLFEPLPQNLERLNRNLVPFVGRYRLDSSAVGLKSGPVDFGWEPTGRYGGIGREVGSTMTVNCLDSNEVLRGVLDKHGRIDILKIDIESLEHEVTERIPVDVASRIGKIYVENRFDMNPLSQTHVYRQYGSIARFLAINS
jgi:FkbM family methyltransferase